jgi:hypothetical protein
MRSGEKIPGYSGYVPFKFENVGVTCGQSNRIAEAAYRDSLMPKGKEVYSSSIDPNSRTSYVNSEYRTPQKQMMVSNASKNSKTWLCGP